LSEPDINSLFELYRQLLTDMKRAYEDYKRARSTADRVLLPQELFEVDQVLADLEKQSGSSQKDLNQLLSESAPAREVLLRNISALERAIEGMKRVIATLEQRIRQATGIRKKRKPTGKGREPKQP
jgi:hypothetical protein